MAIYTLAPLLGPAVRPRAGGFIAANISWRWIFYTTSIAYGFLQLASFPLLGETYAPKLLRVKAQESSVWSLEARRDTSRYEYLCGRLKPLMLRFLS